MKRCLFPPLLARGVRVFRFPAPMIHAKTTISDGTWGTVGSTNLFSRNPKFVEELKAEFLQNLTRAEEVTRLAWNNRSLFYQFLELLSWSFHNFF